MPPRRRQPIPDTPRAILYLRQSIARDDSVSLELQETAGRDYCARMGYDVIDVVSDPGRTGTTLKRRKVQDIVARIERREADIIVVWRWSRLARSQRDFAIVCDQVETAGGRVESSTEPIDVRHAAGQLARGMMAEVAQWESRQRGEVWKEVHAGRRSKGVPAQGGRRFGYQTEPGSDRYEPDPETGPVLAEMYRRYLNGAGFIAIAAWLNNRAIPTLAGRPWTRGRVTHVLDSGFGAGQILHDKRGARVFTDGVHPPVITADEWGRYQRLRGTHRPSYGQDPAYMLSGLLRCGDCLSTMHSCRMGVSRGYGYWCSRWAGSRTCRCVTITRHRAEKAVTDWLTGLAGDVDAQFRRSHMAAETRTGQRFEAENIARRITRLDERLHRLTMGWTEGTVPDTAYRTGRDEIMAMRATLETELAGVETSAAVVADAPAVPLEVLDVWPAMSPADQRVILRPLLAAVQVHRPADSLPGSRGRSRVWMEIVATWGERFVEDQPGRWIPAPTAPT